MRILLDQLFNGNIHPAANLKPDYPEYNKCAKYVVAHEQKLLGKLNDEEKEIFTTFQLNLSSVHQYEVSQAFIDGYRLGAAMTIEALGGKEDFYDTKLT